MMQLALYKGPPTDNLAHKIGHAVTCWYTGSPYSHCELVINGLCHSSSARDGGVRAKRIDLTSGRWDVVNLPNFTPLQESLAFLWFDAHLGDGYDWVGLFGVALPWRNEDPSRWFCSEAVASALGLHTPWRVTPANLAAFPWAK